MTGSPFGTRPAGAGASGTAKAGVACAAPHEGQDAMHAETFQQTVRIANPQGLHLRPITAFAKLAQQFQATVTLSKDGRKVDGKSPLEMMLLAAPQGSEVVVEARGPDAREAVTALADLLATVTFEDDPEPPLPPKG
jgi:phosphocarrier protein